MNKNVAVGTLGLFLAYVLIPLNAHAALPPLGVYKTKADYSNLISIGLSEDKTRVVSFPDPKDISVDGRIMNLAKLHNGYVVGGSSNMAFISMTYEQYARLNQAPSAEELYSLIVDASPLSELYDCGSRTESLDVEISNLNKIIDEGKLAQKCKTLLPEPRQTTNYLFLGALAAVLILGIIVLSVRKRRE